MRYIGADLHKHSITFCVVELANGKTKVIQRERIRCQERKRLEKFLAAQATSQLVVEASIGYEWFAELAEKYSERIAVAHPSKMRIIAESTRKTDKIDAFVLAEFLAKDMIPEAWRPTPRVRQHRSLVRRRHKVQSHITRIKNTMRGILTRYNADCSNLFTQAGWQSIQQVQLLDQERWILNDLWEELQEQIYRRGKLDKQLEEFAKTAPHAEQEARAILATMPWVGPITIDTVLAELGDWRRFKNAEAVISFAGLDPGVRSSDQKRHDLKLSKAGSPLLRWAMIQLAHRIKYKSARWEQDFVRISKRAGKKKATCAIARRLLTVMYAMLRNGEAYRLPKVTT
jgi:transposase